VSCTGLHKHCERHTHREHNCYKGYSTAGLCLDATVRARRCFSDSRHGGFRYRPPVNRRNTHSQQNTATATATAT
jgi:hypothetical protein